MPRALLTLLSAVLPLPALALSCLPWHVEDAYRAAAASPAPYLIVTGTLSFAAGDLPRVDWDRQQDVPPETRLPARLTGTALGPDGASVPFDGAVTLVVSCAGPWCPQLQPDATYLAFLERTGDGHALAAGPCGGMAFQAPDGALMDRLRACLDGGACAPPGR